MTEQDGWPPEQDTDHRNLDPWPSKTKVKLTKLTFAIAFIGHSKEWYN